MLRPLYQQSEFPVFQNRMYDSATEARTCPTGDIALVEDMTTGLVHNAAFDARRVVYDGNYQNEQALSENFRSHLETVAGLVEKHLGRGPLIEVGCGKAYFLEMLLARGVDVLGFDATYEGSNPKVFRRYFEPGSAPRADGLILRHVLEHIKDPITFLQMLQAANDGGRIYIEVPCFDWICRHRAWFDVFYEHVNYFRLADFTRMFGRIVDAGHLFGGQYIYVIAELSSLRRPSYDPANSVVFPADFSRGVSASIAHEEGGLAVWGGASKGVIFSLLKSRAGQPVDMVIDINPAKQGKFLPGTGLRVASPAEAMRTLPRTARIVVMNSNYLDEIRRITECKYDYIRIDDE